MALRGVLESIADTPGGANSYQLGKLKFIYSREDRQSILHPIICQLRAMNYETDIKLNALSVLLHDVKANSQKAIIFCERRATVVYLVQGLRQLQPGVRVIATIEEKDEDKENLSRYEMKETREIEKLIKQFAPLSNNGNFKSEETYDVFISTDAHGVGVNMQDASIVVNYDIDWTPIGPVQRAGRILRFWHSPRTVQLYTFVPTLISDLKTQVKYDLIGVLERWEKLMLRHQESRKLIDLPVLTNAANQEINVVEMASQVTIQSGKLNLNEMADFEISPYYMHTARLQLNRDYAQTILDDLISAKIYSGLQPLLYLLLRTQGQYQAILYDPASQKIKEPKNIENLLDLIACDEQTETASSIDYDEVEKLSNDCIQQWGHKNNVLLENIERICTLYLSPKREGDRLLELLPQDVKALKKSDRKKSPNRPG